jgi:mono/diheme cytochrome c family protein
VKRATPTHPKKGGCGGALFDTVEPVEPTNARTKRARRIGAALALLGAVFALGAGGARRAEAHGSHGKVIRGVVTYQRLCAGCHGTSGHGDGPRAADWLSPPVDLTTLARRHGGFDRRAVASWISGAESAPAHGPAEHPVWQDGGLRLPASGNIPRPLDELLDYLEHLQSKETGTGFN